MPGISNGQLLTMTQKRRTTTIESLSPQVRQTLANIADLGAQRCVKVAQRLALHGRPTHAQDELSHAAALRTLKEALLAEN